MSEADADAHTASIDDAFGQNALESFRQIFWEPEIARRGGVERTGPIRKAVALLRPGADGPEILFNEEAELLAHAHLRRDVAAGEALTSEDVVALTDLHPAHLDPDAGWVAMVVLGDGRTIAAFDFRRNRGKATRLLRLAHEYWSSTRHSLSEGHLGPALDSAFTAAELAVTAMMYLSDDEPLRGTRNRHGRRVGWLNTFTRLDNAPRAFHRALSQLGELRASARYGEPALTLSPQEARALVLPVEDLLGHARARVGEVPELVDLLAREPQTVDLSTAAAPQAGPETS